MGRAWCAVCLFRGSITAHNRRAKATKEWWKSIKRRYLIPVRIAARVLQRTPSSIYKLIQAEELPQPTIERGIWFVPDVSVYAYARKRLRTLLAQRYLTCLKCGKGWLSTAERFPFRCPRCKGAKVQQTQIPWLASITDWRTLNPPRRGRKRAGKYILCATCGKEKWVRPSFSTRFCSQDCRADSIRGVPLALWARVDADHYSQKGVLQYADGEDHGAVLLRRVDSIVPQGLPEDVRSDVCQALLLKVLEQEVSVEEIEKHVSATISTVYHDYDPEYGLSLDRQFGERNGEDDTRSLHDLLPGRYGIEDMLCWGCEGSSDLFSDGLCKPCYTLVMNKAETQRSLEEYQAHRPHNVSRSKTFTDNRIVEMLANEGRRPLESLRHHTKKTNDWARHAVRHPRPFIEEFEGQQVGGSFRSDSENPIASSERQYTYGSNNVGGKGRNNHAQFVRENRFTKVPL